MKNLIIYRDNYREKICGDRNLLLPKGELLTIDFKDMGAVYGHGFNHLQPYPWERGSIDNPCFEVNNIQSPVWMCAEGYVIVANTKQSLSVVFNKDGLKRLEITCQYDDVEIQIYSGKDLTAAHCKYLNVVAEYLPMPHTAFINDSMFCTWTQYPRCITQERVVNFANEIRLKGYPCSVILIDDQWEEEYGDFTFSKDFKEPIVMIEQLHNMGFLVLLWLTPFMNVGSQGYNYLLEKGWLVKSHKNQNEAAHFKWWGGCAALPDLSIKDCYDWFVSRLTQLKKQYGVDGFKIDGGDGKYQPNIKEALWNEYFGASGYSDILLSAFEKVSPGLCESRTAWMSQERNIAWRQGGKDSRWGIDNGLHALITLGLNISLLGYRFYIPDMVGGRVQTMSPEDPLPSDELFIRFVECSALMPGLQFSYFPWNYGNDVDQACLIFAQLHKELAWYRQSILQDSHALLVRPVWYNNEDAAFVDLLYNEDSEFMLGNDLVAAPVLEEGMKERTVVLPPGDWCCPYTGKLYRGGIHQAIPTPCPGMPIFIRKENTKLLQTVSNILGLLKLGSVQPGVCSASYKAGIKRDLSVTG